MSWIFMNGIFVIYDFLRFQHMPELLRSILLAICICYRASLVGDKRKIFDENMQQYLGVTRIEDGRGPSIIQQQINA